MTTLEKQRKLFARNLAANLKAYRQEQLEEIGFPVDLGEQDPELADWTTISDPSLRAAWIFTDDFFDVVSHGFDVLHNGWSIEEGLAKLDTIVARFQAGQELRPDEIEELTRKPDRSFSSLFRRRKK